MALFIDSPLTEINLDDLVTAFGCRERPLLRSLLRFVFRPPAAKFAARMLAFDRATRAAGLADGARRTLPYFVRDVRLYGRENLPASGPVLFLSNHPGMTDTLCLFAAVGRRDLRIIAMRRPFLQSLPAVSEHLIYISDEASDRVSAVRKASAHLRGGGALLTFPAGRIEPDPDVYPGALEALDGWLESSGVFLRFAPQAMIVPLLVRNVLWAKAVRHPLIRLRRRPAAREQLGASLQLLAQTLFDLCPLTVRIQAAPPLGLDEIGSSEPAAIHAALLARMRALIQNPPTGEGISAL